MLAEALVRRIRATYRQLLADQIDRLLWIGDESAFARLFGEVWPVLQWDHRPTARRLFEIARGGPGEGVIVEIGSFLGNSTVFLAAAGRGTVHAVDPHDDDSMLQVPGDAQTSERFLATLRQFGADDKVIYHRATSIDTARSWQGGPVRFLFIDGLHTYSDVVEDFESWQPHFGPEHVVLFDDFLWPEVDAAVRELRRRHGPPWFAVRGGQAIFSTQPLSLRMAGLP